MLNVHSLFHRSMRRLSSDGTPAKPGEERPAVHVQAPERKAWQYASGPAERDPDGLPLRALGIAAQLGG